MKEISIENLELMIDMLTESKVGFDIPDESNDMIEEVIRRLESIKGESI